MTKVEPGVPTSNVLPFNRQTTATLEAQPQSIENILAKYKMLRDQLKVLNAELINIKVQLESPKENPTPSREHPTEG